MFACNGILFNHESPIRGETFVTRKVTRAAARIRHGLQKALYVGNLDAKRDWGYAKDYVELMWLMLQQPQPDDFVIATGVTSTVREFVTLSFARAGFTLQWEGKGVQEKGVDAHTGDVLVQVDPRYFRPAEVDILIGDAAKARSVLGWKPKMDLRGLVDLMVDEDLKLAERELHLKGGGFPVKSYHE